MHACSVITEESCRASMRGGRGSTPSVGARGSVGAVEARRASTAASFQYTGGSGSASAERPTSAARSRASITCSIVMPAGTRKG